MTDMEKKLYGLAIHEIKAWVKIEMFEIAGPNCTSQDVILAEDLQTKLDDMATCCR